MKIYSSESNFVSNFVYYWYMVTMTKHLQNDMYEGDISVQIVKRCPLLSVVSEYSGDKVPAKRLTAGK